MKTWAVINLKTGLACSMGLKHHMVNTIVDMRQRNPKFQGKVLFVKVPETHTETGSFWTTKFR